MDTHIRQVLEREYPRGFPFARYREIAGILQQYMFYYELTGRKALDRSAGAVLR